jgi:acyl carrier protein
MNDATWPVQFEDILRQHLPAATHGGPLRPGAPLADQGLDSLRTVSLLLALEDEFEVSFPDDLLAASTFTTAGGLWDALATLL